ncbi:hypothetical protein [Halomontanus rarus]|uniref:hypothetical protein n=1 Tax=Halomontanus rarus TaxID=3034020 RepID=UPI0023E8579A|nr:hypothetical protein [Halovivax sp. TS33]
MGELSDRLLLLVVAGTGLTVPLAGWGGGLAEATVGGTAESVVLSVLALLSVATLVGIQLEFDRVD